MSSGHLHRIGLPNWPCESDCKCLKDQDLPAAQRLRPERPKSFAPSNTRRIQAFTTVSVSAAPEFQDIKGFEAYPEDNTSIGTSQHSTFSTSTITTHAVRDIDAAKAALAKATTTTTTIKPPKYNNFAMNCKAAHPPSCILD